MFSTVTVTVIVTVMNKVQEYKEVFEAALHDKAKPWTPYLDKAEAATGVNRLYIAAGNTALLHTTLDLITFILLYHCTFYFYPYFYYIQHLGNSGKVFLNSRTLQRNTQNNLLPTFNSSIPTLLYLLLYFFSRRYKMSNSCCQKIGRITYFNEILIDWSRLN